VNIDLTKFLTVGNAVLMNVMNNKLNCCHFLYIY